jgi:hypothetical protein
MAKKKRPEIINTNSVTSNVSATVRNRVRKISRRREARGAFVRSRSSWGEAYFSVPFTALLWR